MKRRLIATLLVLLLLSAAGKKITAQSMHEFPPLPYAFNALEPYIDQMTMNIHYERHHRGYFNNLVKAVEGTETAKMTLEEIFANMNNHTAIIRNNAGGHYNHVLFWSVMSPYGGGRPKGRLAEAITKSFGSFENFKEQFEESARTRFGSGWAWLSMDKNKNLFISSTPNQDNPLMNVAEKTGTPILGLDVWEHAYYLKYQNRRADYITNFWNLVNWEEVNRRLEQVLK